MGNILDSAASRVAKGSRHRCRGSILLSSGLKSTLLVPVTGRFLGQRAAGRSSPGLSAGSGLHEERMDVWAARAQAGGM